MRVRNWILALAILALGIVSPGAEAQVIDTVFVSSLDPDSIRVTPDYQRVRGRKGDSTTLTASVYDVNTGEPLDSMVAVRWYTNSSKVLLNPETGDISFIGPGNWVNVRVWAEPVIVTELLISSMLPDGSLLGFNAPTEVYEDEIASFCVYGVLSDGSPLWKSPYWCPDALGATQALYEPNTNSYPAIPRDQAWAAVEARYTEWKAGEGDDRDFLQLVMDFNTKANRFFERVTSE